MSGKGASALREPAVRLLSRDIPLTSMEGSDAIGADVSYLGSIFVTLLPWIPIPAISPFWPKMKA